MTLRKCQAMLLLLGTMACNAPKSEQSPSLSGANQSMAVDGSLKFQSRWDTVKKPNLPAYPALARMAGIQGMVIMDLEVNPQGRVVQVKRVDGAPQLCSTVEKFALKLLFQSEPNQPTTAWTFRLFMDFNLKGFIGVGSSAANLTTEKVATPPPSF